MDQILISKWPIPLIFGDTEIILFLDLATIDPMWRGAFYKSDNLLRWDRKRERNKSREKQLVNCVRLFMTESYR